MAFPFYVYNIAYLAAGFKSQTQNCGESKLVRPFFSQTEDFPISGDSAKVRRPAVLSFSYQVTSLFRCPQKRSTSPYLDYNGVDGISIM